MCLNSTTMHICMHVSRAEHLCTHFANKLKSVNTFPVIFHKAIFVLVNHIFYFLSFFRFSYSIYSYFSFISDPISPFPLFFHLFLFKSLHNLQFFLKHISLQPKFLNTFSPLLLTLFILTLLIFLHLLNRPPQSP